MEGMRTMSISRWEAEELESWSEDENDKDTNCRMSFASAVSSVWAAPNLYDVWIATPASITERRMRLLKGMGLASDKHLSRLSTPLTLPSPTTPSLNLSPNASPIPSLNPSPNVSVLVRCRSDSNIERRRTAEMLCSATRQRITRTHSAISALLIKHSSSSSSSCERVSFFLIKNLDTGTEFVVNEYAEDGTWNRLSDLHTGKQLTMEEFDKCVGYSPVVKELMRRHNIISEGAESKGIVSAAESISRITLSANSYIYQSLRRSKRRGVALIKSVANSVTGFMHDKEATTTGWTKARQSGKSYKELSALHLCQQIQAHHGAIWCIKFSPDAKLLASAGEDRIVNVWEVEYCRVMSLPQETNSNRVSGKKSFVPHHVNVPQTVFGLSHNPVSSFKGHLDDVLDLSWSTSLLLLSSSMDKTVRLWDLESKSCLKLFAHNDYVTCIQFNPMNEDYFISGSLDAKVRIWSIPDRLVVDWTDFHEMVTAVCYTPDGQGAFVGSHKGNIRVYSAQDCKLSQTAQIDLQNKKKSQGKKITGFQFSPTNPTQVLVTSADSRVRIVEGQNTVHKFKGFRNTSSQIAASFSEDGKYVISASEDSNVYVWRRDMKSSKALKTRSFEHFQCRDVSVAIPWPRTTQQHPSASDHAGPTHSSAWGLVVVTAGLRGHIRAYQNFGLPQKVGRQTTLFSAPT